MRISLVVKILLKINALLRKKEFIKTLVIMNLVLTTMTKVDYYSTL
ncbi:hypothetical protein SAMN04488072_11776 [Lentibacillus halodurans]|uniref:Uncharacterized protein n=1 Tax=Lentibacillus halodurans TaxID=237679 RepID=A0A1I1ADG5_9BACI|nr:hypothetical protein SAMN04488072_11776 [Lentibacillus halodurans]